MIWWTRIVMMMKNDNRINGNEGNNKNNYKNRNDNNNHGVDNNDSSP